ERAVDETASATGASGAAGEVWGAAGEAAADRTSAGEAGRAGAGVRAGGAPARSMGTRSRRAGFAARCTTRGTATRATAACASARAAGTTSARGDGTGTFKVSAEAASLNRSGQRGSPPAKGWITRTAQTNAPTIAADARKPARTRGIE